MGSNSCFQRYTISSYFDVQSDKRLYSVTDNERKQLVASRLSVDEADFLVRQLIVSLTVWRKENTLTLTTPKGRVVGEIPLTVEVVDSELQITAVINEVYVKMHAAFIRSLISNDSLD